MLIFVKYGIINIMELYRPQHPTEQPDENTAPESDIFSQPIDDTITPMRRSQLIAHAVRQLKSKGDLEHRGLYEHYYDLLARTDRTHGDDERGNTNLPRFHAPTPEQERALFSYIEDGFAVISQHPTIEDISEEEQRTLTLMAEARDILTLANIGIVHTVASNHLGSIVNTTLTYRDLVSEGISKLPSIVDKFYLSEGAKFSTFAVKCLTRDLQRYISEDRDAVRTPSHHWERYFSLRSKLSALPGAISEKPTDAAFAAIGSTRQEFEALEKRCLRRTVSLDASTSPGGEHGSYADTSPNNQPSPYGKILEQLAVRSIIASADLDDRRRFMLGLHHGLAPETVGDPTVTVGDETLHYRDIFNGMQHDGKDTLPNSDIGRLLGCTPQNVGGLLRTMHKTIRQAIKEEQAE